MNISKLIPLLILTFISAFISGYASGDLSNAIELFESVPDFVGTFVSFIIAIILFITFLSFTYIILDRKRYVVIFILAVAGTFSTGLLMNSDAVIGETIIAINSGVTILALIIAHQKVHDVYSNSIHANLSRSVFEGGRSFLILLAIIISANYYFINAGFEYTEDYIDTAIDKIIGPATFIAERNLNQQIETQVDSQIETLNSLNQEQKEQLIAEINQKLGGTINLQAGDLNVDTSNLEVNLEGSDIKIEGLEEAIKPIIRENANQLIKPYEQFVIPTLAILLYLTLLPFFTFLSYVLFPVSFVLIRILKSVGYFHERKEMVEITRLTV